MIDCKESSEMLLNDIFIMTENSHSMKLNDIILDDDLPLLEFYSHYLNQIRRQMCDGVHIDDKILPLVINREGELVDGYHRYAALKHLEFERVLVIIRNDDLATKE